MITLDDVYNIEGEAESPEEYYASLQRLISAGQWSLQGHTGRAMMDAIEAGECVLGPEPALDYWKNRIPSRDEVRPGTVGSIEYANRLRAERGEEPIESLLERAEEER